MKKMILVTSVTATFVGIFAHAEDTKPDTVLTINGYLETYYSSDFNKPANNTKSPFIYSYNKSDEVSVNLAYVKGSFSTDSARAYIALAGGSYMHVNYAAEPSVLNNIYESNIGLKLSNNNNLWFDAGVFSSHIGFESATGKDNWTLTRSIGADNAS